MIRHAFTLILALPMLTSCGSTEKKQMTAHLLKPTPPAVEQKETSLCVDRFEPFRVDARLQAPFFNKRVMSWPWNIIENDDGTLEDTLSGRVKKSDVAKIEQDADCISTHQGEHQMNICLAELKDKKLRLSLSGGMPAYASELEIIVEGNQFHCDFSAVYPADTGPLRWRITKKQLVVKNAELKEGSRFYAWLSVEFEESGKTEDYKVGRPYKIEGFIKPVVRLPGDPALDISRYN